MAKTENQKLKDWKDEQQLKISDWSLRLQDIRKEMEAEGRLDLAELVETAEQASFDKYDEVA